jgi:hypothetical protein
MTLVRPVTMLTTVWAVVPSGETTLPVVVRSIPGLSVSHLLSISGFDGKAERWNDNAEPGPHSSFEPAAPGVAAGAAATAVAAVATVATVRDATTSRSADP